MRRFASILTAGLILILMSTPAWAITIDPVIDQTKRGSQSVTFNVQALFGGNANCSLSINYGDGSGWQNLGQCNVSTCNLSATHTYQTGGTYTVQVRGESCLNPPPQPPDPASETFTLCSTLEFTTGSTLPDATVGISYSQQLETNDEGQSITYTRTQGTLPSGLSLSSSGEISGIPTAIGSNHWIDVKISDDCGDAETKRFYINNVNPPPVTVSISPSQLDVRRRGPTTQSFTYSFSTPAEIPITITSSDGKFMQGSSTLATNSRQLSVTLNGSSTARLGRVRRRSVRKRAASASASESVTITRATIQKALRQGSASLTYERDFKFSGVSVATARADLTSRSPALAGLEITWLRLRFKNGRAETTVPRYEPNLQVFADLNFVGSGVLQGYWEVDGRRLADVTKTLRYSRRTLTLASPKLPGLPTFESGTHRVRLVITSPSQSFEAPVALYFVETKEDEKGLLIQLTKPLDGAYVPLAPLGFSWQGKPEMKSFVIEFYRADEDQMFFSAQVLKPQYSIPGVLFAPRFASGKSFRWRVLGLNEDGNPLGQSRMWRVHFNN
jgi:hypothetical protein